MTNGTQNKPLNVSQLKEELMHFMGDFVRYRHPLNSSVIYTPGVRHVAEKAEAYWLIDATASWIGSPEFVAAAKESPLIEAMHFWKLEVDQVQSTAKLFAEADKDVPPFITQEIEFTDFPLEEIQIWAAFDGSHWTLYLPSEH